jgi:hypothetical protein
MTNLVDLDRALAAFLEDGPNTAPEAPVIAALAHARTTPRRPDPLGWFRADVMAPRARRLFGLRPTLLLGLLTLVAAGIGAAVIGSSLQNPSVVVPPATTPSALVVSPSPTTTAPSATPSDDPSGPPTTGERFEPLGPPAVPPIHVVLLSGVGTAPSIDIVDESGLLTAAVSGPARDGASFENFDATNDTPTTLRLTWLGSPCDTVHRLTIDPALTTMTIDLPNCGGDSIGVDRTLLLTFSRAVDATTLNTEMLHGRGGVDMPTFTVAAPDSAGNRYDLIVADPGYIVDGLEGSYDPEVQAVGAGPTGIQLVQSDPTTYRLIWRGPACATGPELLIDASGGHWQLMNAPCTSSAADVLRMIDLTLKAPLASGAKPFIESVVGTT